VRRVVQGENAGPLEGFRVGCFAYVVDDPERAESFSTFVLRASTIAPVVAERLDHRFHPVLVRTFHSRAGRVVRVLESSDNALFGTNFLQIVKTHLHDRRHLVMEAEVMVALDDGEVLLACI